MPVPPPKKDETQSEFMHRCVPMEIGSGPDKRPQEQAVAICLDIWRRSKKSELIEAISALSSILEEYSDDDKWASGQHTCPKCGHRWSVQLPKPKG